MKTFLISFFCFITLHAATAQIVKNELTANEIIENSITAQGGREYLQSIKTLYTEIKTEMQDRPVTWVTKEMLPNKGAFQIVYEKRIVFENWYDGTTGYEMVNGEKRKADPDEFKDKAYRFNIFNELDYLNPDLYQLELLAEEAVNNEACYKIKALLKNGAVRKLYFSKKTFFLMREDKSEQPEKDTFTTVYFLNYKKYGNLIFYSELKFGKDDKWQTGKITKLLVNEKITDSDFSK